MNDPVSFRQIEGGNLNVVTLNEQILEGEAKIVKLEEGIDLMQAEIKKHRAEIRRVDRANDKARQKRDAISEAAWRVRQLDMP